MTTTTRTLLGISLTALASGIAFVTGLVNVGNNVGFYVALPTGAICFGLFLISKLLEKETALFDVEQKSIVGALEVRAAPPAAALDRHEALTPRAA